jgi:GTPase SAR1 family protein
MSAVNERTYAKLVELARNNFNVLLTGSHGVGKTTLCKRIQKDLAIQHVKYYSAATLDPWVDVVGVPVPKSRAGDFERLRFLLSVSRAVAERWVVSNWNSTPEDAAVILDYVAARSDDSDVLRFCRPEDFIDAEWVIFDEINRSHSKVQNALLEMIQFRTINGQPLPNLKMAWALQNPPGGAYQVTELDPAMIDRFHARVTLTAQPSAKYYFDTCMIPMDTATALVDWWTRDLKDDDRAFVTPRTLEAIGLLISRGVDWKFALGDGLGVHVGALENRIGGCAGLTKYERIDFPTMALDLPKYEQLAATDSDFAIHVVRQAQRSWGSTNYKVASVLLKLPSEYMMKLLTDVAWTYKMKTNYKDDMSAEAMELFGRVSKACSV